MSRNFQYKTVRIEWQVVREMLTNEGAYCRRNGHPAPLAVWPTREEAEADIPNYPKMYYTEVVVRRYEVEVPHYPGVPYHILEIITQRLRKEAVIFQHEEYVRGVNYYTDRLNDWFRKRMRYLG